MMQWGKAPSGQEEGKKKPHIPRLLLGLLCGALFFTVLPGCSLPWFSKEGEEAYDTGFVPDEPGIYDSADTAVFVRKNDADGTLTFQSTQNDRRYTLSVTGTTYFYDKYGTAITVEGLQPGQIVDLTFYKPKRRLNTLQVSPDAWVVESAGDFEIREKSGLMTVGKDSFKLSGGLCIFSGTEEKEVMDIASMDTLSVYGMDKEVYSLSVSKGHGYLRLTGDEYFYGGWIEVGEKLIRKISENMLLTVPEGESSVLISHKGISSTYKINVARGQEVTLDIGAMKDEAAAVGEVVFTLNPGEATLYVDGTRADTGRPVSLEYGIHQLIARAEGYETLTQYLRVGSPTAGISVTLQEKSPEGEESSETAETGTSAGPAVAEDVSGGDVMGNAQYSGRAVTDGTSTIVSSYYDDIVDPDLTEDEIAAIASTTGAYYVVISAPEGAEAYFDGMYVGQVPCNCAKKEGMHVITIRKSGYLTRSYTVQIDNTKEDIVYSFPELVVTE